MGQIKTNDVYNDEISFLKLAIYIIVAVYINFISLFMFLFSSLEVRRSN
jgi:hypothetical protein